MQLNFAKKWIKAFIGLWCPDTALRASVLDELAARVGGEREDEVLTFSPPGRWLAGLYATNCGGERTEVEIGDPDGAFHLKDQRLDLVFEGFGPDRPPQPYTMDGFVIATPGDPLPAFAQLARHLELEPSALAGQVHAFHLQSPVEIPDKPEIPPHFVGPDPTPAARETARKIVTGLVKEYCSCMFEPMGQDSRELRLTGLDTAVSARDSRPRERS